MTEDFKVIKFESSSWKVVHKISQLFQCSVVNCIDIFLDYMLSRLQKITWSSVGDLTANHTFGNKAKVSTLSLPMCT